ncbi:S9 family peptidase [Mycolicibacterium sp. 018/SC-01/001]|uniref:alpha/beta hydrolase family protein n=1 Tax=Mycolicibacterium sp. 018/SC-01/001 TaxID=2592069 RepID=UPI00163D7966|nr:alpha/beta hydrolase [Mycolicibacterium sp. 018/SC-01/001]
MSTVSVWHKALVTACAMTRTTNLVARRLGAAPFLPRLFVSRYANMGGLDPAEFAAQVTEARSLAPDRWCDHWNPIAAQYLRRCTTLLRELHQIDMPDLDNAEALTDGQIEALRQSLSPGAVLFADHGPQPSAQAIDDLVAAQGGDDHRRAAQAFAAIDAWVKALTYYQVSAFPGHDPHRMAAYRRSRDQFDVLVQVLAPSIGVRVEQIDVTAGDGQTVQGWLILPPTPGPHPVVLATNGLEGTVQELAVALLRYRGAGLATFLMEMPGSYAYTEPMSVGSEAIYRAVIDRLVSDDRLDPDRIAMVGVSFGGYWAARMAATDSRLACAVACGAPTHHSFHGGFGMPDVIIHALAQTLGVSNPIALVRALRRLSIRDRYADITIPLLAINGTHDTLLSTQDTIDLADAAPDATLLLYPNDDHCAMGHYRQWLDHSQTWLRQHLAAV